MANTMVGGDGVFSYAKNSTMQRDSWATTKESIKEVFMEVLDVKIMLSNDKATKLFNIADLGCSIGPNTFFAVQDIVNAIITKCHSQGLDTNTLEFQVFFNDQATNDFNTLFTSLPNKKNYLVAGVPGSFYGRLFPSSSIHIAYSSYSLHWISRVPVELEDEKSFTWNRGRIHYTGAPDAIVRVYIEQFERDVNLFLRERAREMVRGGMIIILMIGVPNGVRVHTLGLAFTFLGSILMDMVAEGLLNQQLVDSFNIPHVYPSMEELTKLIKNNGCFDIVRMELRNILSIKDMSRNMENVIKHIRAITECSVNNHMGHAITEQLFARAFQQKDRLSNMFSSIKNENNTLLFTVLQRK